MIPGGPLARVPLLAIEVARETHTPLPAVLAMAIDEILFWHERLVTLAEVRGG